MQEIHGKINTKKQNENIFTRKTKKLNRIKQKVRKSTKTRAKKRKKRNCMKKNTKI